MNKKTTKKMEINSTLMKVLNRSELKKINGGYTVCPTVGYTCKGFVCQYPGQFIPYDFC